jgi:hypothetical protein
MADLFGSAAPKINKCLGCGEPMPPGHVCKKFFAKARAKDPATSHEAARKVEKDGVAQDQRSRCLAIVQQSPGLTAGEIQAKLGFLAHKRLPELRDLYLIRNGEPRKCTVNGTRQMTWWPVDERDALPPFIDALGVVSE